MERNIDFVVPMVFPDDAAWRTDFNRYHDGEARANVRFRSWGTEELLISCCERYMPWLHTIYILLYSESQRQPWMERHEKVRVVYHRDFIPSERLPCFASPCIEMFLHRIPGLSEQFIYANDDMFPLSPLRPDDFFQDGRPCFHVKEKSYPSDPNIFERKCMYQQNMIGSTFGRHYEHTWLRAGHSFAPILKSACEAVWQEHGDEILRWLSPFRRTDHSFNHYIYLLHEYFSGIAIDHAPREQYAGEDTPTPRLKAIIADKDAGIVCLNDNEDIDDWQQRADVVRRAISTKLGIKDSETEHLPTVCIVHYNTPKLTQYAIRSLLKHTRVGKVVVFDNSDRLPFMMKNKEFVADHAPLIEVIDNTHGQIIDFDQWLGAFPNKEPSPGNNYGSAKHCYSVEWLTQHTDTPFILMDSDVLVRRDISDFCQHPGCAWVGEVGENVRERFGYDINKVQPFLCWLNVPLLKQHGIHYFNPDYMWNLTHVAPNHRYDTGAWLYRAVQEAGLPTHELPLYSYIFHLGHASFRDRKPMEWVWNHRETWE